VGEPPQSPPDAICPFASGLQRIIANPMDETPVIYTIPPLTEFSCLGFPLDAVGANIQDGWACVAVRVVDNLGNAGVSAPLRVCFDHDGDGAEGCPAMPSYPIRPDVTVDKTDVPITPTANPGIDCTGRYFPPTPGSAESTNAAMDCTPPPNFPAGNLRMLPPG
jgi:hypothetical protein